MTVVAKERPPLLPERRRIPDFFVCDLMDAVPKGDMASMEHPIFSLSTKPDHRIRRYEHGSTYVEIKPSADGLATGLIPLGRPFPFDCAVSDPELSGTGLQPAASGWHERGS